MKHHLIRLISLLLTLCLILPAALAESADDAPAVLEELEDSIRNLFVHDGALYAQTYWDQLYRQVEGGWRLSGSYPDNEYDIVQVYTSGEDVWFLVRKEATAQSALCYQFIKASFDAQGCLTAPESPVTIDWDMLEYDEYPSMYGFVVDGDVAYLLAQQPEDWSSNRLYHVDLTTGEAVKLTDEPLMSLSGYKGGLLLAARFSWDETDENGDLRPIQAVTVDPATCEVTFLGYAKPLFSNDNFSTGGLAYDPETDSVYYSDNSHVYRVTPDDPELIGYLPPSTLSRQTSSGLIWQGRYYVADYDLAASAALDATQRPQKVLRVQQSWALDDDLLRAFAKLHPEIAIEYVNDYWHDLEDFTRVMQSDRAPDVFSTTMSSNFVVLRDKKYLMDLSSSQLLTDLVGRMYPHLTAELLKDGQLFALPVYLDAYTFGYYPLAFEKAGVPTDNIPTTFGELLDFVETWYNEYYDDNEGMEFIEYTHNPRRTLFHHICNALELSSQASGTLTYNTPTIRSLLTRLDELRPIFDEITPYSEDDDYPYIEDNALFTEMDGDPLPRLYRASDSGIQVMTLALDSDTPPVIGANMEVLGINPFTDNAEAAFELLEYIAQNLGIRLMTTMLPDQNDPIEVYEYEKSYERQVQRVADLEARLEWVAPEDRRDLEDDLNRAKTYLASLEGDGRWAMTTEEILWYREHIAPYLTVQTRDYTSPGASDQMNSIRQRYFDGQLNAEEFIQEMDRIVWMVQMEH